MSEKIKRGVAICHYNRQEHLLDIIEAVRHTSPLGTKIVVCDDGSETLPNIGEEVILIKGPNRGVAANKNRALWALQDCHFICILEDDLIPTKTGWFEAYESVSRASGIHHFCRVEDKEIPENVPSFSAFLKEKVGLTPIYGAKPRGDLTFLTSTVVKRIGAFNPKFMGAGYAHGEWSDRVTRAGLINHPYKWVDVREARDKINQIGDRAGGRWLEDKTKIENQLLRNKQVLKELRKLDYTYHPLVLE